MEHINKSLSSCHAMWQSFLLDDLSLTTTEEISLVKDLAHYPLKEIVKGIDESRLDPRLLFLRYDCLTTAGIRFLYRKVISGTYHSEISLSMIEEAICADLQMLGDDGAQQSQEHNIFSGFTTLELFDVQRWLDWIIFDNESEFEKDKSVPVGHGDSAITEYLCAAKANLTRILAR